MSRFPVHEIDCNDRSFEDAMEEAGAHIRQLARAAYAADEKRWGRRYRHDPEHLEGMLACRRVQLTMWVDDQLDRVAVGVAAFMGKGTLH